jgi:hypothetical protein
MDRACEPSLFTKRRRVGSGRVQVCAYEQPEGPQLHHAGFKLPELSWVADEHVQEEGEAIVEDSGKFEEVAPREDEIPCETTDEQIVDADNADNEDVDDEDVEEHSRDAERVGIEIPDHEFEPRQERIVEAVNDEHVHDEHVVPIKKYSPPVSNGIRNDIPGDQLEGIVVFQKNQWKPCKYLCLYCQQRGSKHSTKNIKGAMEHRAECKHNPKRKTRMKSTCQPFGARNWCWKAVGPGLWACRACFSRGGTKKSYTSIGWVRNHWLKCKFNESRDKGSAAAIAAAKVKAIKETTRKTLKELDRQKWAEELKVSLFLMKLI